LLITRSHSILAAVGRADQHPRFAVDPDRLSPSEWSRLYGKMVAALFQFPTNPIRQSGFDLQFAVEGKASRLFHRGLNIQPPIQNRRKETRMTGCLIMPAHDSERHRHPAVFP